MFSKSKDVNYKNLSGLKSKIDSLQKYITIDDLSGHKDFFRSVISGTKSWVIRESGRKIYFEICQDLMLYFNNVSLSDCEFTIDSFLKENFLRKTKLTNREAFGLMSAEILKLKASITEIEVFLSVFNVEVEPTKYSFGKVEFCNRDIEKSANFNPQHLKSSDIQSMCWTSIKETGTKSFVHELAEELILKHVYSISFMYYHYILKNWEDTGILSSYWRPFQNINFKITKIGGNLFTTQEDCRILRPVKITTDNIRLLEEQVVFNKLNNILKETDTEISLKISNAIAFYNDALLENEDDLKLLKFVVGIESLLGTSEDDNESRISANLREKAAFLLGNSYDERKKIISDIRTLYNERCKIGHGEKFTLENPYLIYNAQHYLAKLIIAFVEKYDVRNFYRNDDIHEWFTKKKLS